jgi:uncharacterized membrane protein YciS (DUF1049 family)
MGLKIAIKKTLLFSFIFLLSCPLSAQQDFTITSNYLLFEDAASKEPILVYNDSMAVRGFDFKNHFKVNFPHDLSVGDFNDYQYLIDGVNYFADDGCGIVLKFENNIFKRIDKSFKHKNQYFAFPFLHEKTIYLWGGYGLFTFKNILTYFDFSGAEWLEKKQIDVHKIEPRRITFALKKDNDLYLFGGETKSTTQPFESVAVEDNNIWRLDLKDFSLHRHKKYNKNLDFIKQNNIYSLKFQIDTKIIHVLNTINEIDIFNNNVKTYTLKNYRGIRKIIYHKSSKSVSYIYSNNKSEFEVINEPYTQFRGSLIKETYFYEDSISTTILMIVLFIIFFISIFLIIRFYYSRKKLNNLSISFNKKNDSFYFKNNIISLGPLSLAVLKFFFERKPEFFPINELNDVLSSNLNQENYLTINKRRERIIKELTLELSTILNTSKENIFLYKSNEFDKRIKEIKLNISLNKKINFY